MLVHSGDNLSDALSANTLVQELIISENTCSYIQERSLSGVSSATILPLKLSL